MARSRDEALSILSEGHASVLDLIAGLPEEAALRPGLGGGEWSVKDLLGHLTSWEEHALDALAAWQRGEPAPVHLALDALGLDGLNEQTHAAKAGRPFVAILADFESVHRALLSAIGALTEEAWDAVPAGGRGRPAGYELGRVLAGPGDFDHHAAHLHDLRRWLAELRA